MQHVLSQAALSLRQCVRSCNSHEAGLNAVELMRGATAAAVGGADGTISVWDLRAAALAVKLLDHHASVTSLSLHHGYIQDPSSLFAASLEAAGLESRYGPIPCERSSLQVVTPVETVTGYFHWAC